MVRDGSWASDRGRVGRTGAVLLAALHVLLCSAVVALVAFPASAPARALSTRLVVAQAVAFPLPLGVGAAVLGFLLVSPIYLASRRRAQRSRGFGRRAAGVIALASLVALAASAWSTWNPASDDARWSASPGSPAAPGRELRVVTFNSLGAMTSDDLKHLVEVWDPDVVVVPEAPAMAEVVAGSDFHAYEAPAQGFSTSQRMGAGPTVVLVRSRVGAVTPAAAPATAMGSVGLGLPGGLRLVGVHTAPPVLGLMDLWHADLDRVAGLDAAGERVVVAGDLNATLRHEPLARLQHLQDAASECGGAERGTWPADGIAGLRAPIDHVLVGGGIQVKACRTERVGSSDHLALMTVLELPQG